MTYNEYNTVIILITGYLDTRSNDYNIRLLKSITCYTLYI